MHVPSLVDVIVDMHGTICQQMYTRHTHTHKHTHTHTGRQLRAPLKKNFWKEINSWKKTPGNPLYVSLSVCLSHSVSLARSIGRTICRFCSRTRALSHVIFWYIHVHVQGPSLLLSYSSLPALLHYCPSHTTLACCGLCVRVCAPVSE